MFVNLSCRTRFRLAGCEKFRRDISIDFIIHLVVDKSGKIVCYLERSRYILHKLLVKAKLADRDMIEVLLNDRS